MKILIDNMKQQDREHARMYISALEKAQWNPRNLHGVSPRGIPEHLAQQPIACSECGRTYWSTDPYAVHVGCGGSDTKARIGF